MVARLLGANSQTNNGVSLFIGILLGWLGIIFAIILIVQNQVYVDVDVA